MTLPRTLGPMTRASLLCCLIAFFAGCGDGTKPDGGQPCTTDLECAVGEYCNNGVCTTIGGDDDPRTCSEDRECEQGEICEGGLCIEGVRPDGGDGDAGGDDGGPDGADEPADGAPQPDIFLAGDVVAHQDAQGVTYEINFGNVTMGVPVLRNLTVRNLGDADLVLTVVTLTDDPDSEFNVTPQVPPEVTIPPGDEHTLVVEYAAVDGLTDLARARIFSNDPDDGQVDVELISEFKGEAAIAVDPVVLDFGDRPLNSPETRPITISNSGTGNAVLRIDDVAPEAAIAAAFDVRLLAADGSTELSTPAYINRGDFITAEVTFLAPARAEYEGNLVITSSDEAASPTTVTLRGSAGVPDIEVTPASIDFGQVPAGVAAPNVQVTVHNAGVGDLTISAIELNPAGDFSLVGLPGLPASIAPDAQQVFEVGYLPGEEGQDTALLSIAHDDPNQSTIQISVGGEGIQGNAKPTAVIRADGVDTDDVTVQRGQRVNLDANASFDNDGTIQAYEWRIDQQPPADNCGNPASQLSNTTGPSPFIIPQRGGFYTVALRVRDDDAAWSDDDYLSIQAISAPVAEIRQGGNDTGFVEIDMPDTLSFNGDYSTDCDGSIAGYQWSWVAFPAGRGSPPALSGGGTQHNTSVMFDFPGEYTLGLVVTDNDVPVNESPQVTFDIRVRGPKAFRVTADWYNNGNEDHHVDVDLHLIKPGGLSDWSPDACCPKDGPGGEDCDPTPNWGALGSPVYQTDGYEDDGVLPVGAPGDEINLSNPGMGQYTIKVQYRCMSSTDFGGYWCCNDDGPPCWFPMNFCLEACSRTAEGVVTVFVTDYFNNETQLVQRSFAIDSEQVLGFDTIGVLSWPDGNFQ